MSCENTRELLALRLYDELEAGEGARIDAHLAACEACRATAAELERGLGRLRVASLAAHPPERPRPARFQLRHVAAAFAAGLLVSWFAATARVDRGGEATGAATASAAGGFRRVDPPPPATGAGRLGPLGAWLRR